MKQNEQERLFALTEIEREYWAKNETVAGMDEVGRGPLAGPVTVACACMPNSPLIEHVNDSKKVTENRREKLYPILTQTALCYRVEFISQEIIDEINILEATKLGFMRAFANMSIAPDHVICDYVSGLDIGKAAHILVHGDAISYCVGAASIIAKVERDRYMREMHELYPMYNFAKNKGYGTAEHIAALKEFGPCPLHRKSFIGGILAKTTTRASGAYGESLAAEYLSAHGYELLAKNYRCGACELDLVMRDGDCLVFVEVKSRSDASFGTGAEAVTKKKQDLLVRAAIGYCNEHDFFSQNMRFDVVEVNLSDKSVTHYENAFVPNNSFYCPM